LSDQASGPPGGAVHDLEAFVRRTDPDRWLSSRFASTPEARADLTALYAFDRELARIPHAVTEPLAGEIRFAWWREALEEIDAGGPARAHPVLQALAKAAGRTGVKLAELEPAIELHARRLDPAPFPDEAAMLEWLAGAGSLSAVAVRLLDPEAEPKQSVAAVEAWTLARTDLEGRIAFDPRRLDACLSELRAQAASDVRKLSAAAFPAVAHAALARTRSDRPGGLAARLRLTWAIATGRT
jgi:phytoene synthase